MLEVRGVPDMSVRTCYGVPSKVSVKQLDCFRSTGYLVACDPYGLPSARRLVQRVSPGMFAVTVYRVDLPDLGSRVALAWVYPTDRPQGISDPDIADVIEWRPARYEGDTEEASKLLVDHGMAAYCDNRVARLYARFPDAFDAMHGWLEAPYVSRYEGRNEDVEWMPVIGFLCGLGDGAYPSFWGYDADGNVLGLLTDFLLISGAARGEG